MGSSKGVAASIAGWLLGVGGTVWGLVVGRGYRRRRAEAEAARLERENLLRQLAADPSRVDEDAIEELQARTIFAAQLRAEAAANGPIWRHPQRCVIVVIVLLTGFGLFGVLKEAGSIAVEIEAQVDQIKAQIAGTADSEITLGLHGLLCSDIEITGAAPGASGGGPPATYRFFPAKSSPPAEGAGLSVRVLEIPRGVILAVEAQAPERLTIRLTPPPSPVAGAPAASPRGFRIQLDVPRGFEGAVRRASGVTPYPLESTPFGPLPVEITGRLAEHPVEVRLRLMDTGDRAVVPISLQGIDLADIRFGDYRQLADSRPRSYLLGGTIRFPGRELEPIPLRFGETLSLTGENDRPPPTGQLLALRYVNAPQAEPGDPGSFMPRHRLHLVWSGVTHEIRVGHESRARSRMPKLLFAVLGSREQLYLMGVIIYAAIFAYSLLRRTTPGAMDTLQPTELM